MLFSSYPIGFHMPGVRAAVNGVQAIIASELG